MKKEYDNEGFFVALPTILVSKNDPRLCIKGTEHLYVLYRVTNKKGDTVKTAFAYNLTGEDARLIAHLVAQ